MLQSAKIILREPWTKKSHAYPQYPNDDRPWTIIVTNSANKATRSKALRQVNLPITVLKSNNTTELYNIKMYMNKIRNLEHIKNSDPADKKNDKFATENIRKGVFSAQQIPVNPNPTTKTYIPAIR